MQTLNNFLKYPRLTKEEWLFYHKNNNEFYKKYNLQFPLYVKIAASIHSLAVKKLVHEKNKEEAIKHHIKACIYDPSIAIRFSTFRKEVGLTVYKSRY